MKGQILAYKDDCLLQVEKFDCKRSLTRKIQSWERHSKWLNQVYVLDISFYDDVIGEDTNDLRKTVEISVPEIKEQKIKRA